MARICSLLFIYVLLQIACGYGAIHNLGIYGGHNVSIEAAPFMVALYIPKTNGLTYFCGGSIVHKKFVLTAAHCLRYSASISSAWGYVGSDNLKSVDKILIKPVKKICQKDFKPEPYNFNDICILKLKEPLTYGPKVAGVKLPDEDFELEPGTQVNVTGWGNSESSILLGSLRQVTIPIVARDYCPLTDRGICAGSKGHGTCYGDSGGPLTYNNIQIGVVSHRPGQECAGEHGTVFTSVAGFSKWIKNVIINNVP